MSRPIKIQKADDLETVQDGRVKVDTQTPRPISALPMCVNGERYGGPMGSWFEWIGIFWYFC